MNILQATPSNIGGESWGYFLLFKRMILIKFDNNKQNKIIIIVHYLIDPLFQYNWRQPSFYKATNILYHIFFNLLFLSDWFVNKVKGLHWSKESCLLSTQKLAVEWQDRGGEAQQKPSQLLCQPQPTPTPSIQTVLMAIKVS